MNIQTMGRRGLNPSLAGRPEGGPSPPRAGTGYEPGRQGGKGGLGRPPPTPQLGPNSLHPRCGAAAATGAPCHPSWNLRGPESRTWASGISAPHLARPRSPGLRAPTKRPSGFPAPPPGRAGGPGHQPRGTLEAERPAPRLEQRRIQDLTSPSGGPRIRAQDPPPGLKELGIWTCSTLACPFWGAAPITSKGPRSLGSLALRFRVI
jgi:hypothetical protein